MTTPEGLHDEAIVTDLHCHPAIKSSIFHRDLGSRKEKFLPSLFKRAFWPLSNRASFPKIADGGVDILLSTAYVPEGGWYKDMSLAKWLLLFAPKVRKQIYESSYYEAITAALDEIERQAKDWNLNAENKRKIMHCVRPSMVIDALKKDSVALIHSVEGAHSIQGTSAKDYPDDIRRGLAARVDMDERLVELNNRGVAYLTLAHFYPNECVNPVFPWPEYAFDHGDWEKLLAKWDETKGITSRGIYIVERMLELGMLIDISHCTLSARKKIYEIAEHHKAERCLLASHVGAYEVNRLTYNLQDWELKWFADHGCVAGIIFMNYWLTSHDTGMGLRYIEQTLSHMINVAGEEVVGIGTDFDGFTDPPDEIVDISQLPRMTQYLMSVGYKDKTIRKFLGENALNLLLEGWKGSPET